MVGRALAAIGAAFLTLAVCCASQVATPVRAATALITSGQVAPHSHPAHTRRTAVALRLDPHWRITRLGAEHAIEGWADRTSVLPGEPVGLHVSSVAPRWSVTAFRMGWYGATGGARVWQASRLPGIPQVANSVDPVTNTVRTDWPTSLSVPTAGWPPGAYLLRLDSAAGQRFVPLTVRSPDTTGRIVLVDDVTTWQAYNQWGGYDLYNGPGGTADFASRSRVVTFDRPYDGDGSGQFLKLDLPTIAHAERLGLPLAYATDIDLHAVPTLLTGARAVVTLGHDEYWSTAMRSEVTRARDAGVNVAFLGANAVFRHIRLAPTRFGPDRDEVNYKAPSDPMLGVHDAEVTVNWREPPVPRPESVLTGVFYECNPVSAPMVVTDPENWVFAGTGASTGLALPHLVGPEYDRVNPGVPTPAGIEVLTHSPVTCRGVASFADSAWYTVASGAGVFASGSNWFTYGLPEAGASATTARVVGGELTNLLLAFAAGPAGLAHPSRSNLAGLNEFAGDPVARAYGQ
ncbi:N,N-dimethylformamidase beta subunit family domain-containing protein [Oryzihumus sp.]|uniref:N,N-dimethylformamidase beta subunit family domain-containing protein n=1 Tax=Oryzihumus sp. TaxID=1968903 RepID=UPI002ED9EAF7